ncbi:Avr1b-1 Avirulence-like protein [Phytophthora palmivora]|uniref:RxLR effector protein n=1 Tax=Phytophthora palmivora TaxID=4796 RepID=A0A2P4XQT6_9STRA|nr:Avr1b-1 Avirulence-like protein [Phytophthora palmivora]
MRLFNPTLVVLAAALLASGAAVSSVSNADVVHSSDVLAGMDKRILRGHHTTDDEGELPEHDKEERNYDLFAALKLQKMQNDEIYRFKMFGRWKSHGHLPDAIRNDIPESLFEKYSAYRRIHG